MNIKKIAYSFLNFVIKSVNGIKYAINPTDWKNKSDIKLPWKPIMFSIFVFSGKIKFGSLGEYVINATNKTTPPKEIKTPNISANLLMVKLSNKLAVFLIFILMNQFNHFVSSNFYC